MIPQFLTVLVPAGMPHAKTNRKTSMSISPTQSYKNNTVCNSANTTAPDFTAKSQAEQLKFISEILLKSLHIVYENLIDVTLYLLFLYRFKDTIN
jgi:hypothetical protein